MNSDLLYKGFEVELFTGSHSAHVGLSDLIEKTFSDFVKEPDKRNVEYIPLIGNSSTSRHTKPKVRTVHQKCDRQRVPFSQK